MEDPQILSAKDENTFECAQCGEVFGTYKEMTQHMRDRMKEGNRHIHCRICGRFFELEQTLTEHIKRTHPTVQDLPCPGCGKQFGRAGNLMRHIELNQCPIIPSDDVATERNRKVILARVLKTKHDYGSYIAPEAVKMSSAHVFSTTHTKAGLIAGNNDTTSKEDGRLEQSAERKPSKGGAPKMSNQTTSRTPSPGHLQASTLSVIGSARPDSMTSINEPSVSEWVPPHLRGKADTKSFSSSEEAWPKPDESANNKKTVPAQPGGKAKAVEPSSVRPTQLGEKAVSYQNTPPHLRKKAQGGRAFIMEPVKPECNEINIGRDNNTTDSSGKSIISGTATKQWVPPYLRKKVKGNNAQICTSWETPRLTSQSVTDVSPRRRPPSKDGNGSPKSPGEYIAPHLRKVSQAFMAQESKSTQIKAGSEIGTSWEISGASCLVGGPGPSSPAHQGLNKSRPALVTISANIPWNTPSGAGGGEGWFEDNAPSDGEWGPPDSEVAARAARQNPNSSSFDAFAFFDEVSGKFDCPKCTQTTDSAGDLIAHLRSIAHQTSPQKPQCPQCLRFFKTTAALTAHVESQSSRCRSRDAEDFRVFLDQLTGGITDMKGIHEDRTNKYVISDEALHRYGDKTVREMAGRKAIEEHREKQKLATKWGRKLW